MTEKQWQEKWAKVKTHGEALEMFVWFMSRPDMNADGVDGANLKASMKAVYDQLRVLISEMPRQ